LASGIFVIAVNAWMNTPTGFVLQDGAFEQIDLARAFFSPAFVPEALHMVLAAYASVAFAVLGIHAAALLKAPASPFHRRAAAIALGMATITTPLQLFSGDVIAKAIAEYQPVKLAAAEAHFETAKGAAIVLGGIPDTEQRVVHGAIRVPYLLSVLAKNDPNATVVGLDHVPQAEWPPVAITHFAFDLMVGSGLGMLALVATGLFFRFRKRDPFTSRAYLRSAVAAAPLGLVALEAGWTVTEVGRQPWIIAGVLRTRDAVTPMPFLVVPLTLFTLMYLFLGVVVLLLLGRHVGSVPPVESGGA
jgi:cytochrome d ubiquinol oxidase subunit I